MASRDPSVAASDVMTFDDDGRILTMTACPDTDSWPE